MAIDEDDELEFSREGNVDFSGMWLIYYQTFKLTKDQQEMITMTLYLHQKDPWVLMKPRSQVLIVFAQAGL